ncbi:hypothetical protein LUZ63_013188 [Rhynchospora breviuscula]|uniref:tRNA-uridine aminocarboxypropyltransferase n=1 Tax=Rhynchospora breviuscula TaxID=2022672 RepID=A0A9Q0C826_9POAL|nr:hypothetical protein LUZ63_013188 [Rhynchospora breviuscula]
MAEAEEEMASLSLSAAPTRRRATCDDGCGRPKSVCICPFLPPSLLATSTSVVILQHPHELRYNRLATVPFLSRCLSQLQLLLGRRLRSGLSPLLDSLHSSPSSYCPVLFLFPSPNAVDLSEWAQRTPLEARTNPVLVLVDGTWNQAREMATGSLEFLSEFATFVSLGCEIGIEVESPCENNLLLKKEPHKGCLSTIEAVARALRILEPDNMGSLAEETLLKVLRAMVGFQAPFMKPMQPRPKLNKKKEKSVKGDSASV